MWFVQIDTRILRMINNIIKLMRRFSSYIFKSHRVASIGTRSVSLRCRLRARIGTRIPQLVPLLVQANGSTN